MNTYYLLVYNIAQILMLLFLGIASLYIFLFAAAGLFYRDPRFSEPKKIRKIAVLIPGYKEDDVIIEVAREALQQTYPAGFYDVIIIADSFLQSTLDQLEKLAVRVIVVSFAQSTKSKALNKAMEQLDDGYDLAVVLDADNVMSKDFLARINAAFDRNFMAVQGHRMAKNSNTSMAVLDAASEEINNHIFRKGHRVLGLSSAIIGSGMAFRYVFFREMMKTVHAVGGFDKEIELKMLKAGHKIDYLDQAFVYDEKVQKAEVFSNQRRRWLSAQLHYFRQDFLPATRELVRKGNLDYFDKAFQFIQPPRILLLGAVLIFGTMFMIINILSDNAAIFSSLWTATITACLSAFIFSLPSSFYNFSTLKAMLSLPKGMILMLLSLLKIRGANKQFIHTKHTATIKENM